MPKEKEPTNRELSAQIDAVANAVKELHEELGRVERRLEGKVNQVFIAVASLQNQTSSLESDVRNVKKHVLELYQEKLGVSE